MQLRANLKVSVSAFVLATFAATTAQAQDVTYLNEIILLGGGLPTEVMDSAASVSVLGGAQIKRVPPSSVAQVLNEIPGVRVAEDGAERITIRGENASRVAILIDGQRVSDHGEFGAPILISPASIERIEVLRGSSSVVSGNRAIGGVVNIITKRGADVPFQITTDVGYLSATDGYRASVNLQGSQGNLDYRLTMSQSDQGPRKAVTGTLSPSGVEDRDLSMFLGYTAGNHYIGGRVQDFDLSAEVYTGDPDFSLKLPKRDLRKYSAFYEGTDLTPWMSSLKVDAFTQTLDRHFDTELTLRFPPTFTPMTTTITSVDEQTTSGLNVTAELDFAPGHRSIVGFEYENDRLVTDKSTAGPFGPPATQFADATIETLSFFGQHEIEFSDKLTATLGGRYYHVSSDLNAYQIGGVDQPLTTSKDSRFLGAVGLVYKPAEDTTLRASVSQGYSNPSLTQLYVDAIGRTTTLGNADLKPETSTSFELGARLDRGAITMDGTLFYTRADNYIAKLPTGNPSEFQYQNVNAVKSLGAELGIEYDSGIAGLRPYANLAYLNREFTFANGYSTSDSGTAAWSGTVGVRGDLQLGSVSGEWDVFVSGESGATLRDDTGLIDAKESTSGYATLNLRASADLTDALSLTFEADNLLNKEYTAFGQDEGAARNFSLFLTATF